MHDRKETSIRLPEMAHKKDYSFQWALSSKGSSVEAIK
jgi:hypothetical protein